MRYAEPLLEQTMRDWKEKARPGKTEGLRLQSWAWGEMDVRFKGEQAVVRRVGGLLQETGGAGRDTTFKVSRAHRKIAQLAKAWTSGARNQQHKMPLSVRFKVMKAVAVVMPTLTCFGRSRVWNREHIAKLQRVINYAVRRCFQVRKQWMQDFHVNSRMFCDAAQWEPFEFTIARQTLFWLGHVARMGNERLPTRALFGWWQGHLTTMRPPMRQQQWLQYLIAQVQTTELDWFRLAQDREEWTRVVLATYPVTVIDREQQASLNRWSPGQGAPLVPEGRFRYEKRKRERCVRRNEDTGLFQCPICPQGFAKSNSLVAHYVDHRAVADPTKMTIDMYGCEACGQYWRNEKRRRLHDCPVQPRVRINRGPVAQEACQSCGVMMTRANLTSSGNL